MERKQMNIISGALAGLTALMLIQYQNGIQEKQGNLVSIVVAGEPLSKGNTLLDGQLRLEEFPEAYLHPEVIREASREAILGQQTARELKAGQPVLWTDLVGNKDGAKTLPMVVPKGMRAFTIPVEPSHALSGMLEPTYRVDVLLNYQEEGGRRLTKTMLQHVLVLAVDKRLMGSTPEKEEGDKRQADEDTVTLLVSPRDAELLAHTIDRGTLSLSLRSAEDHDIAPLLVEDFESRLNIPLAAETISRATTTAMVTTGTGRRSPTTASTHEYNEDE